MIKVMLTKNDKANNPDTKAVFSSIFLLWWPLRYLLSSPKKLGKGNIFLVFFSQEKLGGLKSVIPILNI